MLLYRVNSQSVETVSKSLTLIRRFLEILASRFIAMINGDDFTGITPHFWLDEPSEYHGVLACRSIVWDNGGVPEQKDESQVSLSYGSLGTGVTENSSQVLEADLLQTPFRLPNMATLSPPALNSFAVNRAFSQGALLSTTVECRRIYKT